MNEATRNIPRDAIEVIDHSPKMRSLQRRQLAARWGLRAVALTGLYQIKDALSQDIWNMLPWEDQRVFVIVTLASTAFYASLSVNYHINKQKDAMRINEINRQLQATSPQHLENYSPPILPEGHLAQYAGSARRLQGFAQRVFDRL